MATPFWIAQVLAVFGALANIFAMQINEKNKILVLYVIANWTYAANFFLLDAYVGGIICVVAGIETLINNIFDRKNKNIPKWLLTIYFLVSGTLGIIAFHNFIDIMPIICAMIYIILITEKKESNIRKLTLLNMVFWTIYDVIVMSYSAAIFDFAIVISTIVGIYRYDYVKSRRSYE